MGLVILGTALVECLAARAGTAGLLIPEGHWRRVAGAIEARALLQCEISIS